MNSQLFLPQVFFDVSIDGKPAGRIVMGLFGDTGEIDAGALVILFDFLC